MRCLHSSPESTACEACYQFPEAISVIPMQDVLDWLQAHREDFLTPAQITKQYGYECSEGSQLHKTLLANNKIGVSADGSFTYKARSRRVPALQMSQ